MREKCIWCGALALRASDGTLEWAIRADQAGCDHELLDPA